MEQKEIYKKIKWNIITFNGIYILPLLCIILLFNEGRLQHNWNLWQYLFVLIIFGTQMLFMHNNIGDTQK